MTGNRARISLEPEAQALVDVTANPPFLYQLPPEAGRKAVDDLQSSAIWKPEVDDRWLDIQGGPTGSVKVRIVKPHGATETLPVILYTHGAGWVFGDAHTHDRLVQDLAVGANAAVVFPEYDRSPEVHYPVANEQAHAVAQWVGAHGADQNLDGTRVVVAGDSVGGNMAIALTLMAKERGDVSFLAQALFYPVTDAACDTGSYKEFATGYYLALNGMEWFWDQYTTSATDRQQITASPLKATTEQLFGLPAPLVINAEADVLRDEGEAFAAHLRNASVPVTQVRFAATVHDFVMLNSLHDTHASRAAIALAVWFLKDALHA